MADLVLFEDKENFSRQLSIKTQKIEVGKEIVFGNVNLNRKLLESRKVRLLLSPHLGAKKDFNNFRNSGLNHVLCAIAKKNKVAIGFCFSEVLNSSGMERVLILSRMRQNVRLCNKYGVSIRVISMATEPYELRSKDTLISFARVLGVKPKDIKKAVLWSF